MTSRTVAVAMAVMIVVTARPATMTHAGCGVAFRPPRSSARRRRIPVRRERGAWHGRAGGTPGGCGDSPERRRPLESRRLPSPGNSTGMIRVLLVDDQQLIRTGLRRILAPRAGFEVVGGCSGGAEGEGACTR